MTEETFQEKLQRVMREQGVTKSELARRVYGETVNVRGYRSPKHFSSITRLFRPGTTPQAGTVERLAKALHVEPKDLMPGMTASKVGSSIYVEQIDERTSKLELSITAPTEVVRTAVLLLTPYAS